jgi:Holliday junction resolvasome RuvABC endonuclease subunit
MRLAVKAYDANVKFITYEPAIVKKLVGATAHGNKVAVKTAVGSVSELMSVLDAEVLSGYDEHGVDSIAVAYTHLLKLRRLVVT